jgi:hypothetical protein
VPNATPIAASQALPLAACMEPSTGLVQWQLRLRLRSRQLEGGGSSLMKG